MLLSDAQSLIGLYLVKQKYMPVLDKSWYYSSKLPVFLSTYIQLTEYISGIRQRFDISYQLAGTDFQQRVWSTVSTISYGETVSYQEIANMISYPKAVRAVATAVGRNPLLLIVPCHRVVGSDGSLTGYTAGLKLKNSLLVLERYNKNTINN